MLWSLKNKTVTGKYMLIYHTYIFKVCNFLNPALYLQELPAHSFPCMVAQVTLLEGIIITHYFKQCLMY